MPSTQTTIPFELERDITPKREITFAGFSNGKTVPDKARKPRRKREPIVGRVTATSYSITVELDLVTISEGNARENHFKRANRHQLQRTTTGREVANALGADKEDHAALAIRRTSPRKRKESGFFGPAVEAMLARQARLGAPWIPCVVTLTRLSPCGLDDDNVTFAMKKIRDGVADALGVNDRDRERVRYDCNEEKTKRGSPVGVRIRIERRA